MNTLVIGCRTMENELTAAMKKCRSTYDTVWIEARLHNIKKKLNTTLQDIIDTAKGYDRLLFATGFCGNSISGLKAGQAALVFPRVDDCTSLLFGSCKKKLTWINSYFLTEGWLTGEANIWNEYLHAVQKYGEKRALRIFHTMFAHYTQVALLDTGCYDLSKSMEKAKTIADAFALDCRILPATTAYLEALLAGPWDPERFLIIPPGGVITDALLAKTY